MWGSKTALALVMGASVATALVVGTPATARADDDANAAEVKKHFSNANELYKEQRYGDALIEYDAAYELSHNFKILYNRGQCLVMVKREPEAIETFHRYLTDGAKAITDDRRTEVEAYIKELEGRLGGLLIAGAPDGAVVEVDGRVAATTPLAHAISVGAGQHEIITRPPGGGVPSIQKVSVIAGKEVTLKVELGVAYAPAPVPAPVVTAGAPTGYDAPAPAPPPPPSQRPPTGLLAPSFMITAMAGASAPTNDSKNSGAARTALGVFELGASWRLNSFWELGGFVALAAGGKNQGDSTAATTSSSTATNGDYGYGNYGLRLRLHPVRGRKWDGWLGFDLGRFVETWKNTGTTNFTAQGAALGIGFGVDFSLARAWALGGSLRYLSSTVSCASGDTTCESLGIAGTRGFVELGVRLVWVLPYGQPHAAETTAAKVPAPFDPFAR